MKAIIKTLLVLLSVCLWNFSVLGQNTAEEQTNLELRLKGLEDKVKMVNELKTEVANLKSQLVKSSTESKAAIKKIEDEKKNLQWWLTIIGGGFAGLTLLSLWKMFNTTLPEMVKKEAKRQVDLHLINEQNKFKKIRMAIVSKRDKKIDFHRDLEGMGFEMKKIFHHGLKDLASLNNNEIEYLFIKDDDDTMTLEEIKSIINHGTTQVRYFYFGPKKLPNEIYQRIKSVASTPDTLESNLLKSVRI